MSVNAPANMAAVMVLLSLGASRPSLVSRTTSLAAIRRYFDQRYVPSS